MTHSAGQTANRREVDGLGLFRASGLLDLPAEARGELQALAAVLTGGVRRLWRFRLAPPDSLAAVAALLEDVDQLRQLTRKWAASGVFGPWQGLAEATVAKLDGIALEVAADLTRGRKEK